MLERVFKDPEAINRLRANSPNSSLDLFADYLSKETSAFTLTQSYLYKAAHFNYWLKTKHIPLSNINEATVDKFFSKHIKKCSCPVPKGALYLNRPIVLERYLKALREHNLIAPPQEPIPPSDSPLDKILQDFREYMEEIQGLTPETIRTRLSQTRIFLKTRYQKKPIDLKKLSANDVKKYIIAKATVSKPTSMIGVISSLRSFCRFLKLIKQIDRPLEYAVPKVFTPRRFSTIPRYLTEDQLQHFLSSLDLSTPLGLRIRVVVLLISRLALRIGEVTHLKLEDIDWRQGIITIKKSKPRRVVSFPLPHEVGKALAAYLKKGRPRTNERYIFVTDVMPRGKHLSNSGMDTVIRHAVKRCNLPISYNGTNVFRRTLATELLEKGANSVEIADLFRHRFIDTTKIYMKVNLKKLAEISLPWPEVKS